MKNKLQPGLCLSCVAHWDLLCHHFRALSSLDLESFLKLPLYSHVYANFQQETHESVGIFHVSFQSSSPVLTLMMSLPIPPCFWRKMKKKSFCLSPIWKALEIFISETTGLVVILFMQKGSLKIPLKVLWLSRNSLWAYFITLQGKGGESHLCSLASQISQLIIFNC